MFDFCCFLASPRAQTQRSTNAAVSNPDRPRKEGNPWLLRAFPIRYRTLTLAGCRSCRAADREPGKKTKGLKTGG